MSLDLEAQQVVFQPAEVEGAEETYEMESLGPQTSSLPSRLRSVSAGQNIKEEARPAVSQAEGVASRADYSGSYGGDTPGPTQAETQIPADTIPTLDPGPRNTTESKERRMIGDFDGSANEFWKLYRDEAKSHDDATISTLKEGMDGALIFAGLFSAILATFVADSKQSLQPNPADEAVYYLRQHSAILSQISVQLSSIAPQVDIPFTPPPPFPLFDPSTTDVAVNALWFMALASSLLAALLAILVQQWVRNYMYVFQRYSDPLKSSRLRQYLYEGFEKWKMSSVAEAVTGLLHSSLFIFWGGLVASLVNANVVVGLTAYVPFACNVILYTCAIFVPIIYPQSPYQNISSGILWYVTQKWWGRKFRDHGSDGEMKPESMCIEQRQMHLAMQETTARMARDVEATRWLIDNLTEDAEMEKFLSAIPGSFNTDWGVDVWKRVGEDHESEDHSRDEAVARPRRDTTAHEPSSFWSIPSIIRLIIHLVTNPTSRHPHTHASTPNVHAHPTTGHMHELSTRVARSVEICNNRGLIARNDLLWRKRTRACIESTASLVCCANAKFDWFGGVSNLLGEIGSSEKMRELSLAGTDQLFVMRWTCLSLVAIRPFLADKEHVQYWARLAESFAMTDVTGKNDALLGAQKIDETLQKASDCLSRLYDALRNTEDLTEVHEIFLNHEPELENINTEAENLIWLDCLISDMPNTVNYNFHQIISQLPGVLDDFDFDRRAPIPSSHLAELSCDPRKLQFISPGKTLKSMCSPALTLRNILGEQDADAYKELMKNPKIFNLPRDEMQQQLWRLQDLWGGSGLGFTVELFFLALSQLLLTSSSKGFHSALYTGTFQAITSDWGKCKDSLGTQKLLLNIAMSRRQEFNDYPACITDEFLVLLRNILEGTAGSHIDEAMQGFTSAEPFEGERFEGRLLKVITETRALP